jgi:lipoate-protein ligase A
MAADAALLDAVAGGSAPVLRLYCFDPPALSLGRFQPDTDVDRAACDRLGVEVVRRPTGGRALLHGAELSYAVALRAPSGAGGSVEACYRYLAGALVAGLARLGVEAAIARHDGPGGPLCLATQQGSDLRVGERKVCGSAQVRRRDVVLQHGSILLDRLPFDETDLVVGATDRDALRSATVTLTELGVAADPGSVGDALVEGFATRLDLSFTSTTPLDLSSTAMV